MGHVLGAEKGIFLIRGRGRPMVYGGRAGGILSIPAREVSLGSPRQLELWISLNTSTFLNRIGAAPARRSGRP